jgi:hypothetical protein
MNETISLNVSFWENPQFQQILLGTCDKNSPLIKLCGNQDILRKIFTMIVTDCSSHIIYDPMVRIVNEWSYAKFPNPSGLQINMMPFYLYNKESLPKEYHGYWELIQMCTYKDTTPWDLQKDKKAYLTIDEGLVEAGKTQRRPGLHIDSTRSSRIDSGNKTYFWDWGHGCICEGNKFDGGIYLASNIDESTAIWPCELMDPHEISMDGGSVENLRGLLGKPFLTNNKTIYWMSDCVPHEAMPMKETAYRQFFRLVVGSISVWYSQHSTANPLGIQPDATILDINKFENTKN